MQSTAGYGYIFINLIDRKSLHPRRRLYLFAASVARMLHGMRTPIIKAMLSIGAKPNLSSSPFYRPPRANTQSSSINGPAHIPLVLSNVSIAGELQSSDNLDI